MALSPGTTLGPYQIDAPLGAGGMGEVYKATDTRLDRTVAIKVLPEHVAADPDLKQRFEREARTVAALNHPHICTLHDIGTQDGIDFLVMEYLDGETVAQRLEKGALPLDQALTVAIEIADALDKAHRQGIVHRDLKPGNIMLTKAGTKLLDFGLAKLRKPGTVGATGFSAAATQSDSSDAKVHRQAHAPTSGIIDQPPFRWFVMGNDQGQPKTVDFTLDARTPSKRPEQLAALLEQALQREFPESGAVVEISHTPQTSVVSLRNLEQLEEGTATALTHKARAIYNEFMISPWY